LSTELLELADKLETAVKNFQSEHKEALQTLKDAATEVHKSWSGSNLGYHSLVYCENLAPRPAGAQFSVEWGLKNQSYSSKGSVGAWRHFSSEAVKDAIYGQANHPDLSGVEAASTELRVLVNRARDELLSVLSVALEDSSDTFLDRLKVDAESQKIPTYSSICRTMLPSGQIMSRDSNAVMAGVQIAPHQEIIAETLALQTPCDVASDLAEITRKAGSHMSRKERSAQRSERIGTNVFIGHGGSPLWRELKDFVVDRLKLPHEEFNRVPVAGVTNIARLSEMLDGAGCALILLTAEDETADGSMQARMNVIHEVGLFQGRLGFTKAIVVLEEGCEEFSNIQGLGQIRFPKNNISAAFEEIRAVLEREELL
jgi:predicted nucleotide-binding protein